MKLVSARVRGFQSFSDSGRIEFGGGINLFVGQNNAGKSAFLRALYPNLSDDRHRSESQYQQHLLSPPNVELELEISGFELYDTLAKLGHTFDLPIQAGELPKDFIESVLSESVLKCLFQKSPSGVALSRRLTFEWPNISDNRCVSFGIKNGILVVYETKNNISDHSADIINSVYIDKLFYFGPERFTIGRSQSGHVTKLTSNADNLAAVLSTLKGFYGYKFDKLVEHVREVFPTVGNISVGPAAIAPQLMEVRVWPTREMRHPDLSFSLDSSGTGVAQAIAILACVMTTDDTVVVIDEINNFLHPSAVKALFRIIHTEYAQHQYIVSTHSTDVISAGNPTKVHLVKREGYESQVQQLDRENLAELREVAEHLGVSMSDVFASDSVIWVEGPTEEICFHYIYKHRIGELPKGVTILSVSSTGDFNTKRSRMIAYDVYERLSASAVALDISVAFSFDREKLSPTDVEEIIERSRGAAHFLPRRHFECYLLQCDAIAQFIASRDSQNANPPSAMDVENELVSLAIDKKYGASEIFKGNIRDISWISTVDAARLIDDVCGILSEQRVRFDKNEHSLELMQSVLKHDPESLGELANYVAELVAAVSTSSIPGS